MMINGKYFKNINNVPVDKSKNTNKGQKSVNDINKVGNFQNILRSKIENKDEIKISKHAELRIKERNIELTDTVKEKINEAVNKASQKGVRDSLILVEDTAFIVNVKNRTIITAVNNEELKESVFTNIDGAVIS